MSDKPLVQVRNLRKTFGKLVAVDNVSFDIPRGQVLGFIGANGAGKTTTMRMIVTLDPPTAGVIRVAGHDIDEDPFEVRRRIGWMPDSYGAYDYMSVQDYMDFFCRAFGYRGDERRRRVAEVMEFTDLMPISDRPMNKLSKGMAQRLCLGRTLLHDPDLLVMDEPAAGLDPQARVEFKRLVRLLAGQGKTLFISSHILSELEEMCDALLFIDQGRIVHHGTADKLKSAGAVRVQVEVAGDPDAVLNWATMNPGIKAVETTKHGVRLQIEEGTPEALARILRAMIADGLPVIEFRRDTVKLEDAFISMLEDIRNGKSPPPLPGPTGEAPP